MLSLCFFAHSFNRAELRYSFSDSLNLRTISSKEDGVLGISPQGLPQFELLLIRNFGTFLKHLKLTENRVQKNESHFRKRTEAFDEV